MCVVSAVIDSAQVQIPWQSWTLPTWNDFLEVLRRLDAIDKKLGLKDCEDPSKAEWMKKVEERLKAIEEKTGIEHTEGFKIPPWGTGAKPDSALQAFMRSVYNPVKATVTVLNAAPPETKNTDAK